MIDLPIRLVILTDPQRKWILYFIVESVIKLMLIIDFKPSLCVVPYIMLNKILNFESGIS